MFHKNQIFSRWPIFDGVFGKRFVYLLETHNSHFHVIYVFWTPCYVIRLFLDTLSCNPFILAAALVWNDMWSTSQGYSTEIGEDQFFLEKLVISRNLTCFWDARRSFLIFEKMCGFHLSLNLHARFFLIVGSQFKI